MRNGRQFERGRIRVFAHCLIDFLLENLRITPERTNRKSVGLSSVESKTLMDEMRGEVPFRAVFAPVMPHAAVTRQMPHATYQHCSTKMEKTNPTMTEKEQQAAALRYKSWSAAQLVEATTTQESQYLPEAISAIRQELQSRCIGESEIAALERHAQTAAITAKRRITFALFVFIVSALLSSLIALLFGLGDISRGVPAFPPIGFLEAAWGAYGIYVVTKLWRKRYGAPDHAVWLVRLVIPLNILSLLSRNMRDSGALGGAIIVSIIPPILWLIYLERSKRIPEIYPSKPEP